MSVAYAVYRRVNETEKKEFVLMVTKMSPTSNFFKSKGHIISECPYEIIVYPKIATKKFPRFLSWKFTTSRLLQNKVYLLANRT